MILNPVKNFRMRLVHYLQQLRQVQHIFNLAHRRKAVEAFRLMDENQLNQNISDLDDVGSYSDVYNEFIHPYGNLLFTLEGFYVKFLEWGWQELNNRLHGRFGYGDDVHCDDKEEITILTDYIQQWIGKNPSEGELARTWLNKFAKLKLGTPKGFMIWLIVAILQTGKELEYDPIEEIGLEQTQQSTQYSYDEFSNSQLLLVSDVLDGDSMAKHAGIHYMLT